MAREWRFDESGDIGDVNILIDTSDLPSKPVGFDQYVVWVDDNGLFEDGATQFELTLVGDYYQVAGVDIANGDFVTIGIVRPTVEFTDLNSNGSETSNAAIEVSINYPISSDLTVDYSITGGTASGSGVDYLLNSGTATILAGQTTATINPSIINDTDIESDETISITITNPSSGFLGTNTTHIYTINDDDNLRKIDFTASSTAGNEGTSPVTLTIQINSVDGVNPTTVDYAVTGGTAVGSGTDFTLSSGTATINAGNTTTTFDITITDDLLNEADETIIISLSNPTNSNLGTNQVYTYTINDDDAQPSIEFLTSSSFGYEDAVNASIFVSLSAVSGQDVTVDYTISGGTASGSGVDYNLSNGTAIISAGNLTETIDLTIIDDAISESPETIELTLSAPSGATLGATTVHTMTINDNENDGFTGPGGVGAVDGSSALELWLRSDTDVEEAASDPAEVGDNVEIWKDQSGNGKDVQNDFGSNPTYDLTGSTYGIDFSGGSAYLRGSSVISGTSARTMVVVAKPSSLSATSSNCAVQLAPNEGAGMGYSLFLEDVGASSGLAVRVSGNKVMNYTTGTADPTIFSVQSGVGSNVTDTRFYTDGTEQTTLVIQSAAALNTSTLGTIIGGFSSGADNIPENTFDFNGLVYEVIAFSKELNDAERVIIENYVGAKYNESIANDFYSHEGSQGFDVSGIGQEGTDVHTAAMSAQILGVSGASSLDTDGDYLLFGHDNGDVTTWVTTEAPNSGVNTFRIAREWQFDESGTIGSVNVMIDSNNVPVKPAGYTQYVVWVDADGDFSNGATQHELSLIGDYYQASGLTIADNSYITVGVVRPTIEFAQTTSNGFETTNPTIDVSISYAIGEDVTVDYTVSGGTATGSGVDYTLNSGTVTILAGQTTASISPSIINDTDIESDETIVITVFNPSHGVLGTDITHTYTINDDDNLRKIDFNSNNSSGLESVTPINITIEINNIDIVNPTTVDYAVTGGTAVGTDYTLASGTATIPASSSSTSISLVINEDLLDESDETVIISLSNPTNSNLGTDITYTYTIQDNDASPTVQFNSTASSGSESSSPGLIVELDATSGQDVTVDYAVTGGDATGAGTDYTLNSGTLTILTGNSSENIFISITDDPDIELPETIEVTISNPSNASLGGNTVHTYTILDNDNVGFKGPGGVGSIDGSSTLEVWLKADEGVEEAASDDAEVGDNIEFWRDQSGNANDVENDLGANPVYRQNSGIYSADFSGGSAYLRSNSAFSGTGARTVFTVAKPSSISATTSNCVYQLAPNEAAGMGYGIFYEGVGASNGLALRVSGNKVVNYTVSTANPNIISVQNGANENVTDAEFYADGTAQTTLVTQSANTLNTSSIGVVVGGFAVGATNVPNSTYDFNGDIYEIIVYSEEMSNSKRIIVENYLGAKYGVTVANERYTENQGTVYSFDVAGIGHEGGSDYHEVSESAGILKVSNPTSLASGDYLMFGHDDASIAAWTTTEAPSANEERLAREWYFEETNEVGTVTITIDTTLLPSRNAGFNKFLLYVDTDGDFSSGSTSYVLEDAGGPLFSVDVNISDGDYVAIGAVKYITQVDGDWDQAATWEGGIVPGSEDDAVITSNHVVDLTQNETIGSLSIASDATLNIGSHTLTIDDGCLTLGANATVTMTTGTIRYTKNGDQCVTGNTTNFPSYANLSLEGSNTKTLNGDISVTGALSIDNNVILDVFAGNDYNITLSGNLDNNGTFLEQEGDFTFNGSSNQLITGGSEANFYNLNISNTGGAVQPSVDLDVNGNLTILAGTGVLDANTNSIDVELAGNWVNNNGAGGFLEGTNFVTFNGSSNQNITNSSGSEDYYDLIVSNTGGAVQPTSDLDIANNLSINSGTAVLDLNTNSADLEISGSWINNNGLSGLVGSNQTVTFDNAVTVSILGSPTLGFGNLNISNTSGSVRTGANVEVSGNLVISATGILDAATNSNSVSIGGNWTNNNGTDGFAESNTTVIFNGSSNQSISNNLGTEVFNNLSIENTGGQVQPTTVIDINGDLTINGTGVLNLSTSGVDLQISGNWTSSNGAGFIPGNQTVTF
ncbi:MAG: hypothetical protein MRY83_08020, partial [Flavobacteriales bacterium]|nr:hypothetical protein [Flavobacteriales bacterium]